MSSDTTAVLETDMSVCRTVACADGIERALGELHEQLGPSSSMTGNGGYSMLPSALHSQLAGDRDVVAQPRTDTGELIVARAEQWSDEPDDAWRTGVAWIRLGATERLNKLATDRLSVRKVQGRPTISLALVRAAVGDVASVLAEARYLLENAAADGQPQAWIRIDENIDLAVRVSLKLFGASGYVAGPPSDLAFAITYLGEVYGGNYSREPR
jgi:hypothetical protein